MIDFKVGKDAQNALKSSLEKIAEAIGSTMGPGGMPFGYDKTDTDMRLSSSFSKDGLTVLRSLRFPNDPVSNAVLEYCRHASSHSFVASGDGSSSTIVLANAVAEAVTNEGSKYPQALARRIEKDAQLAIEAIKKEAIKGDEITRTVALTSCNGDEELADIVIEAVKQSSAFGSFLVEKRVTSPVRYQIQKQDGYSCCMGYNYNSTLAVSASDAAASSKEIIWEEPYVATFNGHILSDEQIDPILSAWGSETQKRKGNLIVVAYEVGENICNKLMVLNRKLVEDDLAIFIVKPKLTGEIMSGLQIMRDISAYCGIIDEKIIDGGNYKNVDATFLGTCGKISVGQAHSAFLGRANNHWVDKRILQNQSIVDQARSDYDREMTRLRNAELAEGLVKVIIGGGMMSDIQERADRFDDASKAAQSCMREGALPGAGCSYIRAAVKAGVHPALEKAMRSIYERVMINFGVDPIDKLIPAVGASIKIDEDLGAIQGNAVDLDILDACETVCAVIKNGVALGVQIATLGGYSYRDRSFSNDY